MIAAAQGHVAEAMALQLESREILLRTYGLENKTTLLALLHLGYLYGRQEQYEEAVEVFETCLPVLRRVSGVDHAYTRDGIRGLGLALRRLGLDEEAGPLRRELLELEVRDVEEAVDPGADALNCAAWSLLTAEDERSRDPERAPGLAERGSALARETGSDQLWAILDTLALAQFRAGDTDAVLPWLFGASASSGSSASTRSTRERSPARIAS